MKPKPQQQDVEDVVCGQLTPARLVCQDPRHVPGIYARARILGFGLPVAMPIIAPRVLLLRMVRICGITLP